MQCTATSKRTGLRCGANAVDGKNVCYHHGGRSLSGVASPSYKHGRYSRVLPARLLDRYQEAAQDPELLALREDVALLDTRLADLLKRVDSGETGRAWRAARDGLAQVNRGIARNDPDELKDGLAVLREAIGQGVSDYAAWNEVAAVLEQRRRLVESERKRLVEMQAMLSAEQAMLLLTAVLDAVRRHVSDRGALAAIATELAAIAARGGGAPARSDTDDADARDV